MRDVAAARHLQPELDLGFAPREARLLLPEAMAR